MGLRLAEGIDLARLAAIDGPALDQDRLAALESDGFIARQGSRLAATPEGRLVLNRLILELAAWGNTSSLPGLTLQSIPLAPQHAEP
jgi:oxygen-independent coproporphyrinogen-3 oxidase